MQARDLNSVQAMHAWCQHCFGQRLKGRSLKGAESCAHSQEHYLRVGHRLSGSFSLEEGWTVVRRRKEQKTAQKEEKRKEGKGIKKELCKDKFSSLICRAPSLRTGQKTPFLQSRNFVVPSSVVDLVQDPGIKGALFQEDCCLDFGTAGENMDLIGLLEVCETDFSQQEGASASSLNVGAGKESVALPVVCESDFSKVVSCSVAAETSGEHVGTHGLLEVLEYASSSKAGSATVVAPVSAESADQAGVLHGSSLVLNSRIQSLGGRSRIHGSSHFSHARACAVAAVALPAGAASRSATPVIATPTRFSRSFAEVVADLASACATSVHDSAFNSEVCSQGPTGTKRVKGGVSGPAEDLLPVSEVEAGVNFRPAGGVRGQVAG